MAKILELQINPSNEYSGLISFRIDWFDLLAFQGTLESSLAAQFKSINSLALSFLRGPTLTYYMTTGKTIALTRWTIVSKVMSLLFNMLSRLVFSSKEQASFNFMAAVTIYSDYGSPKKESLSLFPLFPHLFPMK